MKIKIKDLRNMTKDEWEHKKITLKEELYTLRGKASAGNIEKPGLIKQTKRTIARIETLLKEQKS